MKFKTALLGTALLFTTNCSTIINGTDQTIYVKTSPNIDAKCLLNNENGQEQTVFTPTNIVVDRDGGNISLSCEGKDKSNKTLIGDANVNDKFEPWFIGNLLFGGIIGGGVDLASGSYMRYPSTVNVNMKDKY